MKCQTDLSHIYGHFHEPWLDFLHESISILMAHFKCTQYVLDKEFCTSMLVKYVFQRFVIFWGYAYLPIVLPFQKTLCSLVLMAPRGQNSNKPSKFGGYMEICT